MSPRLKDNRSLSGPSSDLPCFPGNAIPAQASWRLTGESIVLTLRVWLFNNLQNIDCLARVWKIKDLTAWLVVKHLILAISSTI